MATTRRETTIVQEIEEWTDKLSEFRGREKVAAMKHVGMLNKELDHIRDIEIIQRMRDPLKQIVALRKLAEREGAWTAATKHMSIEATLRAELANADAAKASAELRDLSPDELMEIILGVVQSIPIELVEKIRDAAVDRLA